MIKFFNFPMRLYARSDNLKTLKSSGHFFTFYFLLFTFFGPPKFKGGQI